MVAAMNNCIPWMRLSNLSEVIQLEGIRAWIRTQVGWMPKPYFPLYHALGKENQMYSYSLSVAHIDASALKLENCLEN